MKIKQYKNITTNEIVNKEDAEEYMLQKLGISSDNWILEEIDYEDIPDLEKELYVADIIYQDNLEKEWGLT